MINSIAEFLAAIQEDLSRWDVNVKPWFRGVSDNDVDELGEPASQGLEPRIANHNEVEENYFNQSFRRQAGGLVDVPPRVAHTDLWLFLAQHYGIPTRLIDWTEGALHALYFAVNKKNPNPRVYMLNPQNLNILAGSKIDEINYPLSWSGGGAAYVALAWQLRRLDSNQKEMVEKIGIDLNIPFAFPATYLDHRMIAQRSCFTIHGDSLDPIEVNLLRKGVEIEDYLTTYQLNPDESEAILKQLVISGVSGGSVSSGMFAGSTSTASGGPRTPRMKRPPSTGRNRLST